MFTVDSISVPLNLMARKKVATAADCCNIGNNYPCNGAKPISMSLLLAIEYA